MIMSQATSGGIHLTTVGKVLLVIVLAAGIGIPSAIFLPPLFTGEGLTPSPPAQLATPILDNLQPSSETGNIMLTWDADPDSVKLKIYRSTSDFETIADATLIKTLLRTFPTSYTDMVTDGTYFYAMTAVDSNGGATGLSYRVSTTVTIPNIIPGTPTTPTTPTTPVLSDITTPSTTGIITLAWTIADSTIPICKIYRASSTFTTTSGATVIFTQTATGVSRSYQETITSNGVYFYAITAISSEKIESPISNVVSVSVEIPTRPLAPTLDEIPPSSDTGRITLTWQVDPTIPCCIIYRKPYDFTSKPITSFLTVGGTGSQRTYTDDVADGEYFYAVTAATSFGIPYIESELSNRVHVTVTKTVPIAPEPVVLYAGPQSSADGVIFLSWEVFGVTANIAKYQIYRSTGFFTTISGATKLPIEPTLNYFTNVIQTNGQYYYGIIAVGTDGLSSRLSNVVGPIVVQIPVAPDSQFINLDEAKVQVGYGYYSDAMSQGMLGSVKGLNIIQPKYVDDANGVPVLASSAEFDIYQFDIYDIAVSEDALKTWLGVDFLYNRGGKSIVFYGKVVYPLFATPGVPYDVGYRFIFKDDLTWYMITMSATESAIGFPNIPTTEMAIARVRNYYIVDFPVPSLT
jgi:fibronectin type 3 domain-containing protein